MRKIAKTIAGARLIDGTGAGHVEEAVIIIEGDKLKEAGKGFEVPKGAEVIDAGTPFNRHDSNAQELVHLVDCGFKPMEAIVAVTKTGSECLGMEDQISIIESGKLADFIVVDGDPLKDIKVLTDAANIHLVLKGGVVEVNRGV
ncbi:MAG: amidohydrolase family protein [Candidatus Bathyarchaeota archaeon]|nr:amidohydrolase family protein [Candidatus Bathyarchaeota archaeon]